jgi:regulator of RNase E activity RraB
MSWLRRAPKGERARMNKTEADRAVMGQLRYLGADLDQPREVIHYLYLPTADASQKAAQALRLEGYEVEEKAACDAAKKPPNPFLVLATSEIVLNPWAVRQFRQLFEQLASHFCGEYDGWEAAAQP